MHSLSGRIAAHEGEFVRIDLEDGRYFYLPKELNSLNIGDTIIIETKTPEEKNKGETKLRQELLTELIN